MTAAASWVQSRATSSPLDNVVAMEHQAAHFKPFAHLTAPNSGLYRRVMLAFVAAKRRFVVHLRAEDVYPELADHHAGSLAELEMAADACGPVDQEALGDALSQLVDWGNLRADPDTSRVTSVEDFHRARFLYQLTHAGEATERSLMVFDEQLGRRGALQAVALADIATGLRALREQTREAEPDPARAGLLLRDLVARCTELADTPRRSWDRCNARSTSTTLRSRPSAPTRIG